MLIKAHDVHWTIDHTQVQQSKVRCTFDKTLLASSLIKQDGTPKQVIKKMGGYMSIATKRLKFLDITNFLAARTNLVIFYESFQVSTPKGSFPYQWFDSLEKLEFPGLPEDCEKFRSILTNQTISAEEFQKCHRVWEAQGMTKFADYVKYYKNADVIGFVEAVEKMNANEKNNRLDIYKDAVSLPGLTQKYLFARLGVEDDYFVGFGDEHKHLAKLLRDNIVGGPSIIFHRYQERDVTLIKEKHVKDFVANSLYLYCLGQLMPTGYYTVQEEANGYKKETRYSRESIQWLEHVTLTTVARIRHAGDVGEQRIGNFSVDSYDESTRTVYEYYGCFSKFLTRVQSLKLHDWDVSITSSVAHFTLKDELHVVLKFEIYIDEHLFFTIRFFIVVPS